MADRPDSKSDSKGSKPNRFVLDDPTGITIGGKPIEQFVAENQHLLKDKDGKDASGKSGKSGKSAR